MDAADPRLRELEQALRRVHRSVLALLALCALVIFGIAGAADESSVVTGDPRFTTGALFLGLCSILARRQSLAPATPPRRRVTFALAGLLLAGSVGLLGVALAFAHGEREAPLLYCFAGAILALRPPVLRVPGASAGGPP